MPCGLSVRHFLIYKSQITQFMTIGGKSEGKLKTAGVLGETFRQFEQCFPSASLLVNYIYLQYDGKEKTRKALRYAGFWLRGWDLNHTTSGL